MKKNVEKFNVLNGQMVHAKGATGFARRCAFCGKTAFHRFKAKGNTQKVYLCTEHMVRFFHLKPNRMTPKLKAFVPAPVLECMPREYSLTRTLQEPLTFFGKKLVCYDAGNVFGHRYFFSLYNAFDTGNESGAGFYLSVTGIFTVPKEMKSRRKTVAMHFVWPVQLGGLDVVLRESIDFFTDDARCHPKNKTLLRNMLEPEATAFFNLVMIKKDEILAELAAPEMGG